MGRIALGLVVAVAACAPTTTTRVEPSPSVSATPIVTEVPSSAPSVAAPTEAPARPPPQPIPLSAPRVTLTATAFPMTQPTGKLAPIAWKPELEGSVRAGIQDYLHRLDEFRNTNNVDQIWAPQPPFRDVVVNALRETARPGVVRTLQIDALRIDAVYQKPWGSNALVEVTTTIRDKVVSGNAVDEIETGRLRLGGESRFTVIDGWDGARGRWFNGFPSPTRAAVEGQIVHMVSWYLQTETWLPNTPTQTYFGPTGDTTPFAKARNEWIRSLDRAQVVSRLVEDVTAEIERFETSTELADGLATIRVRGTVVFTDPSGATKRAPFERRIRAFLLSWGIPGGLVIVDEEASPGVWRSGGNIALKEIDRQFG